MGGVFIIGLPSQLRARLEASAKKNEIYVTSVAAGIGKQGTFQLLPDPADAVHNLRAYYDQLSVYGDAFVVVLPYAPIPFDLENELAVLEELGAEIIYGRQESDGWPLLKKRTRPDTRFLNEVFNQLEAEIFGEADEPPSRYFESISERNPNIIITKGALDTCDHVAEHRREFCRAAANALLQIVDKNGLVGRLDAFFGGLGLEHAQTGGINTTLKVFREGKLVHQETTNTHLKQGDKTSPQAAARIYYQKFFLEQQCYVAVLYAGPHPQDDISCEYKLPPK